MLIISFYVHGEKKRAALKWVLKGRKEAPGSLSGLGMRQTQESTMFIWFGNQPSMALGGTDAGNSQTLNQNLG